MTGPVSDKKESRSPPRMDDALWELARLVPLGLAPGIDSFVGISKSSIMYTGGPSEEGVRDCEGIGEADKTREKASNSTLILVAAAPVDNRIFR